MIEFKATETELLFTALFIGNDQLPEPLECLTVGELRALLALTIGPVMFARGFTNGLPYTAAAELEKPVLECPGIVAQYREFATAVCEMED